MSKLISAVNAGIRKELIFVAVERTVLNRTILVLLRDLGFINNFTCSGRVIKVFLKFSDSRPVLKQLVQISKPGRKVYSSVFTLRLLVSKLHKNPKRQFSNFIVVIRTNAGVVTSNQAIRLNQGGELLLAAYS